jgi:hypothetical protein
MASIQSSIQLTDMMTSPLMHITSALNMTVSAFESMQYAADNTFDTTTFDAVRENIKGNIVVTSYNAHIGIILCLLVYLHP